MSSFLVERNIDAYHCLEVCVPWNEACTNKPLPSYLGYYAYSVKK
jgi:hypothetical protein